MATRLGSAERVLFALALLAAPAWTACSTSSSPKDEPKDPLAEATLALDAGSPRRVISSLAALKERTGEALALELVALTELSEWGKVEAQLGRLTGPEKDTVRCVFGAARRDVTADRICRERTVVPKNTALDDAAVRAWARVAEDEQRLAEGELRLRELVSKRPTIANRKAFVAYLERNGFVAEAVVEVEAWRTAEPEDPTLEGKLLGLLERKVRGDLLDKRSDDAEKAAKRVLELDPKRAQMRYFLADALEQKGDKAGAEKERAAAQAAGAKPPPAPDSFPGLEAGPGHQKPAPPGLPGHDHGHDHKHEHDHKH